MNESSREKILKVRLDKFVPGGQAIGALTGAGKLDGKKCFLWGGLPGELVEFRQTKSRSRLVEGVVEQVLEASADRVAARDEQYLSTSPWQILDFAAEMRAKSELVLEAFRQEHLGLSEPVGGLEIESDGKEYRYRNKMEFSFFGDENGLHLAFYRRGSHGKISITTESLAVPVIFERASEICEKLQAMGLEARDLKTVMVRAERETEGKAARTVAKLFVKNAGVRDKNWAELGDCAVVFSDPKSPASVTTEVWRNADLSMRDELLGRKYVYNLDGFFQVNLGVYELALQEIANWVEGERVLDLYAGVGTIGLTVARNKNLTLVEVSEAAVDEMKANARGESPRIILAKSEDSLSYIRGQETVIVDPPRAGLHKDVVNELLAQKTPRIVYLSCNPTTQARDVKMLLDGDGAGGGYKIEFARAYNFFPHTPHIENLVILGAKG